MRISNNLIVPKNLRGDPLRFFTIHSVAKYQQIEGAFLPWNGFVFHVRGFGCVQNEVLSTHGKNSLCRSASAQKVDHSE